MMTDDDTDDQRVFGDQWVYCASHVRPHFTGWCTVSVTNKLGTGISEQGDVGWEQAMDKCRRLGLPIYGDKR